jgi:hypothetical protein
MLSFHSIRPMPMAFAAMLMLGLLANCGSDRSGSLIAESSADRGAGTARSAAQASAPLVAMAGRWVLASSSGGKCSMNFAAAPGAGEGTIAPEGGCPGRFFTSRKWTFEQGALVIRDHTGQPLAQLAMAAPDRFEGKAAVGPAVSLTR